MVKVDTKILKAIQDYISEIGSLCKIEKVVLYGSYASGNPRKDSDIDLAIFSNDITEKNRIEYNTEFLMHIGKYKLDIHPRGFPYNDLFDKDNDFVTNEIGKKGIEIFGRRK